MNIRKFVPENERDNMAEDEVTCAVPGCDNTLTEEQRNKKISVCSSCEAAKMHLCEACSKKLSTKQIQNGATLCKQCEMNPPDMEGTAAGVLEQESDYESEDYMI